MITWFRLYHDLPDDIKLRRFTPQEKWAWVTLLCIASKSSSRGVIEADDEDIADCCEFNSVQDWLYYRDKLIAKGMLEFTESGKLAIAHWVARQYDKPSDTPEAKRERKRRQRANQKDQSQEGVTRSHANVTRSHATYTDTDLYTDPDPDNRSRTETHSDPDLESKLEKESERARVESHSGLITVLPSHITRDNSRRSEECESGISSPKRTADGKTNTAKSSVQAFEDRMRGWPWKGDEKFLDWLVANHLSNVSYYKEMPNLGRIHAKQWLDVANTDSRREGLAISKYEEYKSGADTADTPEKVKKAIGQQLQRLGMNAVLPAAWQEKTGGKMLPSQLSGTEALEYLQHLQSLGEVDHAC